jgi:hypothetical protein
MEVEHVIPNNLPAGAYLKMSIYGWKEIIIFLAFCM